MQRAIHWAHGEIVGGQLECSAAECVLRIAGPEEAFVRFEGPPGAPDGSPILPARWLVLDVENPQMTAERLFIRFFEAGDALPRMTLETALMANLSARAVFDLQWLDAKLHFPPLFPGTLKTNAAGDATDLADVCRVEIGLLRGYHAHRSLVIRSAVWTDEPPAPPKPARVNTDRFGQWMDQDWPGKVTDEETLRRALTEEASQPPANFPNGFSRFGGELPPRGAATGFFRTEKRDGRWLLVDPDGCPFFSTGVFGVYPGELGWIRGVEGNHAWLPSPEGPYAEAFDLAENQELYRRKFHGMFPPDTRLFSFAVANLIRAFGPGWRGPWTRLTASRLKGCGVNTLSMFSDPAFIKDSGMAYVLMLQGFPVTRRTIFREFSDVFSEEYDAGCRRFAAQLSAVRDDPALVGYFLNNEPTWGFVPNLNLAEKVLESPEPLASKTALMLFLAERYAGDIARFNAAWALSLTDFEALRQPIRRAAALTPTAEKDLVDFTAILLERYAALPSRYAREVDPHHLNLGMRFASLNNPALLGTSRSYDVFSFNCYQDSPVAQFDRVRAAGIDMPMLVGEFHFGALDRGLPAPSLFAVPSQQARGEAYARFVGQAAAHPNAVGAHYFAYNDQPLWGRYDGENYQFGFVDICHRPYAEFLDGVRETNANVYEIAYGRKAPLPGHTPRL